MNAVEITRNSSLPHERALDQSKIQLIDNKLRIPEQQEWVPLYITNIRRIYLCIRLKLAECLFEIIKVYRDPGVIK